MAAQEHRSKPRHGTQRMELECKYCEKCVAGRLCKCGEDGDGMDVKSEVDVEVLER